METRLRQEPARRGLGQPQSAYDRAVRLMRSDAGRAFNLEDEKDAVRDAYGRNLFGQGCLLARRLVEARRAVHRSGAGRPERRRARLGHPHQQFRYGKGLEPACSTPPGPP